MGGPAVFLASEASDFVNGLILYVDGGILAYIGKQPADRNAPPADPVPGTQKKMPVRAVRTGIFRARSRVHGKTAKPAVFT